MSEISFPMQIVLEGEQKKHAVYGNYILLAMLQIIPFAAVMSYLEPHKTTPQVGLIASYILAGLFFLFGVGLAMSQLRSANRYKIVMDGESLTEHTGFRIRTIRFADVARFRRVQRGQTHPYFVLYLYDSAGKPLYEPAAPPALPGKTDTERQGRFWNLLATHLRERGAREEEPTTKPYLPPATPQMRRRGIVLMSTLASCAIVDALLFWANTDGIVALYLRFGVPVRGEFNAGTWISLAVMLGLTLPPILLSYVAAWIYCRYLEERLYGANTAARENQRDG